MNASPMFADDPFLVARMALALLERLPARRDGAGGHVVLVSSATAGEGKSFIAGLLARELAAQREGEIAWVDASFSALTQRIGVAGGALGGGSSGFAHLLAHGELQDDALRGTETPRLSRLGSGAVPGDSTRAMLVFQSAGVQRALDVLRRRFALTLLDGSALAGCGALTQEADAIVLVVNARRTARHVVERALADARIDTSKVAGVVLNRHVPVLPRWLGG